jgi:hypothetical protein
MDGPDFSVSGCDLVAGRCKNMQWIFRFPKIGEFLD